MGKFKEYIYQLSDIEDMQKVTEIIDNHLEKFKMYQPQEYTELMSHIEKLVNQNHFTEDILMEAHQHIGDHFSINASNMIAEDDFEIDFTKESFNQYDFNYVINYMYKIYCNVIGDDDVKYGEFTLAWLDDKNNKALKHYNNMILTKE